MLLDWTQLPVITSCWLFFTAFIPVGAGKTLTGAQHASCEVSLEKITLVICLLILLHVTEFHSFSWLCSLKTWSMNFPEWCLRELFKSSISPGSLARITCSLPEGRYYLQFHLYWSKGLCQYLQDYHLFLWICVLPTVSIFSKQPCLCRAYRIILFPKKKQNSNKLGNFKQLHCILLSVEMCHCDGTFCQKCAFSPYVLVLIHVENILF